MRTARGKSAVRVLGAVALILLCALAGRGFVAWRDADVGSGVNDLRTESEWTPCGIAPEPRLRLGGREVASEQIFFGVEDAAFLPGGRVAVLNRYGPDVRLFGADGAFVARLGRRGDGPGELRDPIGVEVWSRDSVAVWDWAQGRVTVFPVGGGSPRAIRLEPAAPGPTGSFDVADGVGFVVGSRPPAPYGSDASGGHQTLELLAYAPDGALRGTLAALPFGQLLWVDPALREIGQPWFEARSAFDVRDDRLYHGSGEEPEVRVVGTSDPSDVATVAWLPPDRRIDDAEIAAHREATVRRYPHLEERARRNWEVLPVAPEFPALRRLLVDDAGALWVQRYPRPTTPERVWWRFRLDGSFHCALRFTDGFEPMEFRTDAVVGVVVDELGIERVEVRGLALEGAS